MDRSQIGPPDAYRHLRPRRFHGRISATSGAAGVIQQDKEQAIVVREPNAAVYLTPQNDQLMSERRVLGFKPALRLEWRDQDGQYET